MTQAICTSFKTELFQAVHNFKAAGGHVFRCALFNGSAVLNADTTTYSPTNEVVGPGYSIGGFVFSNVDSSAADGVAMQTFANNPSWSNASFSASQALIYNASVGAKTVAVLDFGGSRTVVKGTFTINLPPVTPTTALLRLV